ncbi:MAG TPA: helix-turn-helix domain-containing protein [Candidatus Saccharimonadia bacterium]|nr:helix-turn-helix domain-containing protein [Candidatus Saccharimonadia bacterium]
MRTQKSPRSDCPVNYATEVLGDKWSLLIVRDIVYQGKRTHGEFLKSDEGIARNILADRLTWLECQEIITRSADPKDKRREIFTLTEKGLALIPILLDLNMWSDEFAPTPIGGKSMLLATALKKDRDAVIKRITSSVREGGYLFAIADWFPPQKV